MKMSSLFGFVLLSSPSKIAFGRDDGHQRRREFVTDGYALERWACVRPWPCTARVPVQDGSPSVFDPPGPLCALSHATPRRRP